MHLWATRVMPATQACQSCGLSPACSPAHVFVLKGSNPQCRRHSLRFPVSHHRGSRRRPACSRRAASAVSQQSRTRQGSFPARFTSASEEHAAPEPLKQAAQSAKAQEFAGLGAQRTLDFLAAWDQLALRLPPQAGMGAAAELILNALKLAVAHLPLPSNSLHTSASASKALAVASQLADLSGQGFPLDAETIAAGILVDAVIAQRLPLAVVHDRLGPAVADLIGDVVKVCKLPTRVDLYDDVASSSLRELALTFYDTRAIVVEVVARLVGMRNLVGVPLYARQLAALEALQIYVPLGHGLGLRPLCAQLEDSCFQELFPESYAETAAWLRREVTAHGDSLAQCEQQLQQAVEQDPHFQSLANSCQVSGRTKSLFSTMKKLLRLDSIAAGGRARQEVHDLLASRCVVVPHSDLPQDQAEELASQACYVVASKAAELFEELTARRKDYIACPKENGYQSLHCTVQLPTVTLECEGGQGIGLNGIAPEECLPQAGPTCELQIRTQRMHEQAESGAAAHAAYKGGLDALQANRLQAWIRTLRALPPTPTADIPLPQEWSNRAAAAEQLFSHLDRDGDGYISVAEVAVLLEELGIDADEHQRQASGPEMGQLPGGRAGQKLLGALANKEPNKVSFEEFLHFNSQASLLNALPKVDTETAHSLRRSTSASEEAPAENPGPPSPSAAFRSGEDSALGSLASSESASHSSLPSSESATHGSHLSRGPVQTLHGVLNQSVHSRDGPETELRASTSACEAYSQLLSIPDTSKAQSLAATPLSNASDSSYASSMSNHAPHSRSLVCRAVSQPDSRNCAQPQTCPTFALTLSSSSRRQKQALCGGRALSGAAPALGLSHMITGLSASAHIGSALRSSSSSWQLHAVGSRGTTAETLSSEVAGRSSSDEAAVSGKQESRANLSAAIEQAIDEAAIIDRRLSHQQASSSGSSHDHPGSASELLSTKHNESTLSLDLSELPQSSPPLPPPQPMTKQSGQQSSQRPSQTSGEPSSQQAVNGDSSDAAQLLRKGHNESTISLDLTDLPPELSKPPPRPDPEPVAPRDPDADSALYPNMPGSLDWTDLQPQQGPPSRPGVRSRSPRQGSVIGSWDNLQPLFRPPLRTDPTREPQEPPNEAAAADVMFSALQSRRYKHEKGTSYQGATFALVPVDRRIGWRLHCDEEVSVGQPLHIPLHGPLILGGETPHDTSCDIILEGAKDTGAAAHARLEIFWKGRKPCCLVTCLGPSGNTYINRTQLPRMVDTEAYLGDIISFGELTVAFQFVPVLLSARQQSAVDNAVHYVRARANKEKQVPKEYFRVAHMVRLLTKQGSKQFPEARELMASSLVKEPINAEGWAQIGNMEHRMVAKFPKQCSVQAARCFYRAAAELYQEKLDANASPNGEAQPGSPHHKKLMKAMSSFIRVMSSWAQMEFECRNDTSARRLYRRGLDCVPQNPAPTGEDMQQPIKLLFKWAHQELKSNNLYQSRELLEILLQLEPDNTRGLGMLGSLEWKAGNPQLARELLMRGIQADPKHVANLHTLARLELEEGHLQEARELFAEGQRLDLNNVYVLQSWALAEAADGELGLARDMLQKATTLQPRSVPCWHAWAKLELTAGNIEKARQLYLKALELKPTETFTLSALGALERQARNLDLAIEYLDRAMEVSPRHPPACNEKAQVLRLQGKPGQAQKWIQIAQRETIQLRQKQGHKHANDFVRSSEQQQDERRVRSQKQAQSQARKAAATQKGSKTQINRWKRRKQSKKKAKAQADAAPQAQSNVPFERVVSVPEQP